MLNSMNREIHVNAPADLSIFFKWIDELNFSENAFEIKSVHVTQVLAYLCIVMCNKWVYV